MTRTTNKSSATYVRDMRSKSAKNFCARAKEFGHKAVGFKVLVNLEATWPRGINFSVAKNWNPEQDKVFIPKSGSFSKDGNCKEFKVVTSGNKSPIRDFGSPLRIGSPSVPLPQAKKGEKSDIDIYYKQLCQACGKRFVEGSESTIVKCGVTRCSRLFLHSQCANLKLDSLKSKSAIKMFSKEYVRCKYHLDKDEQDSEDSSPERPQKSARPKSKGAGKNRASGIRALEEDDEMSEEDDNSGQSSSRKSNKEKNSGRVTRSKRTTPVKSKTTPSKSPRSGPSKAQSRSSHAVRNLDRQESPYSPLSRASSDKSDNSIFEPRPMSSTSFEDDPLASDEDLHPSKPKKKSWPSEAPKRKIKVHTPGSQLADKMKSK